MPIGLFILRRHDGGKSSKVAESYIDESLSNKIQAANTIFQEFNSYKTSVDLADKILITIGW